MKSGVARVCSWSRGRHQSQQHVVIIYTNIYISNAVLWWFQHLRRNTSKLERWITGHRGHRRNLRGTTVPLFRLKPGFHYPSWRPELTGDRFPLPVNALPSTRPVLTGNGKRSPVNWGLRGTIPLYRMKGEEFASAAVSWGDLQRLNYNKTVFRRGSPRTPLTTIFQTPNRNQIPPPRFPSLSTPCTKGHLVLLLNWYPHVLDRGDSQTATPIACTNCMYCMV